MNDGVSICFIRVLVLTKVNKKNLGGGETFCAAAHLSYQYHFEDTPREAAKTKRLSCFSPFRPHLFALAGNSNHAAQQ